MKVIIDANFLQDPALEEFLRADKENIVVLSDDACMEAYKGNALKNVSKSLEIIANFPDQAVILKGTREVVRITLSSYKLEDLEDAEQMQGFSEFYRNVQLAVQGNKFFANQILENGKKASAHFEIVREDSKKVISGIELLIKSFKPEQLRAIRKGQKFDREMIEKVMREILMLASFMFQDHPDVSKLPQIDHIRNSFVFRYAIGAYLLGLRWISDGRPVNVNLDKMRNDVIDMGYIHLPHCMMAF